MIRLMWRGVIVIALLLMANTVLAQLGDEIIYGDAYVTDVTLNDDATITIRGELGDPCTQLGNISQTVEDNTIAITVETARPASLMCAMVLETFEIRLPLPSDLDAGDYTLDVSGTENKFTLSDDFLAQRASAPQGCLLPVDDTQQQFVFGGVPYCFLYPANWEFTTIDETGISVATPLDSDISLSLSITAEPAGSLDLDAVAAQSPDATFSVIPLAGLPAIQSDDIPERTPTRTLFVIEDDTLYTVRLLPLDNEETVADVWGLFLDSFQFTDIPNLVPAAPVEITPEAIEPEPQAADPTPEVLAVVEDDICPTADADTQLYENSTLCFLYPADASVVGSEQFILINGTVIGNQQISLLLEVNDADVSSFTAIEAQIRRDYNDPDLSLTEYNGELGFVTETEQGRVGLVVGQGTFHVVIGTPNAEGFSDAAEAMDTLWTVVMQSIVVK